MLLLAKANTNNFPRRLTEWTITHSSPRCLHWSFAKGGAEIVFFRFPVVTKGTKSVGLTIQRIGGDITHASVRYSTRQLRRVVTIAGTTLYPAVARVDFLEKSGSIDFHPGDVSNLWLQSKPIKQIFGMRYFFDTIARFTFPTNLAVCRFGQWHKTMIWARNTLEKILRHSKWDWSRLYYVCVFCVDVF